MALKKAGLLYNFHTDYCIKK